MALHDFLQAMRSTIYSEELPPEDYSQRIGFFKKIAPKLNELEIADLSRIEPEGWFIYKRSIFSIQQSILKKRLSRTIKLIKGIWQKAYKSEFNLAELVSSSQKANPWQGYLTEDLLKSFVLHLQTVNKELFRYAPQLSDLIAFELSAYRISRATGKDNKALLPKDLKVEQFLSLKFGFEKSCEYLKTQYKLDFILNQYTKLDRQVVESYYLMYRNSGSQVVYQELAEPIDLSEGPLRLEALVPLRNEGELEAQHFSRFYALIENLVESGGITFFNGDYC